MIRASVVFILCYIVCMIDSFTPDLCSPQLAKKYLSCEDSSAVNSHVCTNLALSSSFADTLHHGEISVVPTGKNRRSVLSSCLASFFSVLSAPCAWSEDTISDASSSAIITIRLDSPEQRLGLELYPLTIGTRPRPVVAIKRVLPAGVASRNPNIQPGMILLDFSSKEAVLEALRLGPYPISIRLYNLAAAGDAFAGDEGKTVVSSEDALQLAQQLSQESELEETKKLDENERGYVMRVIRKPPASSCPITSRRGDVLEIQYEASYQQFSTNAPPKQIVYDASEQRGTGQPYQMVLGSGDMLSGVDQGLYDMCPGESRELEIPPFLGYGRRGNRLFGIPGEARLFWKVTLVSVNGVRQGDSRTREELEQRVPW